MSTTAFGRGGEEYARRYLEEKGMTFLQKNYKRRHGEVDLIMRDGRFLVFVEVKTRRSLSYGMPAEAVTPIKQQHIRYCAEIYFAEHGYEEQPVRFDVVEILALPGRDIKLRHLKNAF